MEPPRYALQAPQITTTNQALERTASRGIKNKTDVSVGSFVKKLFYIVENESNDAICWINEGSAFHIKDTKIFAEEYLPKYFRHHRFSSLIRQLNFYSFYKVQDGLKVIYQHSFFRRGRPDLLKHIKRRGAGKAKDPWFDPLSPGLPPMEAASCVTPQVRGASAGSRMSPRAKSESPRLFLSPLQLTGRREAEKTEGAEFGSLKEFTAETEESSFTRVSRDCMSWEDEIRKKEYAFDIETHGPLWDRPLSPLNLPDQMTWCDLEF